MIKLMYILGPIILGIGADKLVPNDHISYTGIGFAMGLLIAVGLGFGYMVGSIND